MFYNKRIIHEREINVEEDDDYTIDSEDEQDTEPDTTDDTADDTGEEDDDYTLPDDTDDTQEEDDQQDTPEEDNQDNQGEDDQQDDTTDEENADDDYSIPGDEEGDDTIDGEEQTDNTTPDEEQPQEEQPDELKEKEKALFVGLSDKQIEIKNKELKTNYEKMYKSLDGIIERVSNIDRTQKNTKIIDFIISKLNETSESLYIYYTTVFETKTYIENSRQYDIYILILRNINKLFKEIT